MRNELIHGPRHGGGVRVIDSFSLCPTVVGPPGDKMSLESNAAKEYVATVTVPDDPTPPLVRVMLLNAFLAGCIYAIKTTTELINGMEK